MTTSRLAAQIDPGDSGFCLSYKLTHQVGDQGFQRKGLNVVHMGLEVISVQDGGKLCSENAENAILFGACPQNPNRICAFDTSPPQKKKLAKFSPLVS